MNVLAINSAGGPRKTDDADHPLKEVGGNKPKSLDLCTGTVMAPCYAPGAMQQRINIQHEVVLHLTAAVASAAKIFTNTCEFALLDQGAMHVAGASQLMHPQTPCAFSNGHCALLSLHAGDAELHHGLCAGPAGWRDAAHHRGRRLCAARHVVQTAGGAGGSGRAGIGACHTQLLHNRRAETSHHMTRRGVSRL